MTRPQWWELFDRRVELTPRSTALVTEAGAWTFAELDASANDLAGALLDRGLSDGGIVACAMTRSMAAVVAPLAVGRAGGVYLPLDIRLPRRRIDDLLEDARPDLVITDHPPLAGYETAAREPAASALAPVDGDRPAYVVYTSGSSGAPKGVVVGNRSLVNLYSELEARYFPLVESSHGPVRVAHGMPLGFDAAWNPLLWMLGGYELHLLPEEVRSDPQLYVRTVHQRQLQVVEAVPSLATALVEAGLLADGNRPGLLLMGGEAIGTELWSTLRAVDDLIAVNLYGPTEATVFVTGARLDASEAPAIGHPIAGARVQVVDSQLREVTSGDSGELLVGGACLAQGYLGRPELTAQKFIWLAGERWYRTGDRCRQLPTGELQFQGRLDQQVKLRGYRIEPGEVEHALLALPGVRQAVVRAEGDGVHQRLVAYVATENRSDEFADHLRDELRAALPSYLVPASFVLLESLPLGPHDKTDRAALPAQVGAAVLDLPSTPAELLVAAAWSEVLGIEQPQLNSDFFDDGGHSLLAAQLALRLRAGGVECSLRDVLTHPTIAQLADFVTRSAAGPEKTGCK